MVQRGKATCDMVVLQGSCLVEGSMGCLKKYAPLEVVANNAMCLSLSCKVANPPAMWVCSKAAVLWNSLCFLGSEFVRAFYACAQVHKSAFDVDEGFAYHPASQHECTNFAGWALTFIWNFWR